MSHSTALGCKVHHYTVVRLCTFCMGFTTSMWCLPLVRGVNWAGLTQNLTCSVRKIDGFDHTNFGLG